MKLNNKGFAISTVMYLILVAAVILITLTLSLLSSRKLILDKIRNESKENIYNVYDITYRQALETLKQEYLDYLNTNNITTTKSIKIGDLETSIDSNIINGYNLNDKYLTNIGSSIYLGKSKTITDISTTQDKFIDIYGAKIYGNSYQQTYTGKNLLNFYDRTKGTLSGVNNTTQRDFEFDKYYVSLSANNYAYSRVKSYSLEGDEWHLTTKDSAYGLAFPVKVEPNTTYALSGEASGTLGIGLYDSEGNFLNYVARLFSPSDETIISHFTKSFTTPDNCYIITIVLRPEANVEGIYKNIQLEKGSTATEYEPYVGGTPSPNPEYPQEVKSVGDLVTDTSDANYGKYKIPIKISSKNLIDTSKLSYGIIKSDGSIEEVNWYMYTDYIEVSGDYLTYSKTGKTSSSLRNFNFYDKDKVFISGGIQKTDEEGSDYYTIDIPEGAKYFRLNVAPSYVDKAMVELGNNYTGYEPSINTINIYLNEPLRKIRNSADYVDFANNKTVRSVYEYAFNGNNNWDGGWEGSSGWGGTNTVGLYVYFRVTGNPKPLKDGWPVTYNNYFCRLQYGAYNTDIVGANMSYDSSYYGMRISRALLAKYGSDISATSAFKQWITEKYNSGNPVKFTYELANPAEETLNINHISYGEYSNISVDTSMQPTNMEFTVIEKIKEI